MQLLPPKILTFYTDITLARTAVAALLLAVSCKGLILTYPVAGTEKVGGSPQFFEDFLRTAKNYLILYVLGAFTFLLSYPVSNFTGNQPDLGVVASFAYFCGIALILILGFILTWKLVRMALIEKPASVSGALFQWLKRLFNREAIFNSVHMLIAISLLMTGFGVLKGAIAIISPFEWDVALKNLDIALHFGWLPHEWFGSFMFHPNVLGAFNLIYNAWFVVMISSILVAGLSGRGAHMQYLVSFALTWLFGGFFLAVIFSSAGPAFYELAGYGTEYVPLMNTLYEAAETVPLWALSTQELLWEGYSGARDGSAGISAFPSMHVATAALIAIYASRVNWIAAVAAWIFFAAIMVGSVLLGWHYAVDGYGGFILAIVFWKMAGVLINARREHCVVLAE